MKRAKIVPPSRPRNRLAASPLLRKGGAHVKTNAARRRAATVALKRIARDPEATE